MKTRFSTLDIMSICGELKTSLRGMRVNQIYDIDSKTYLFKFTKTANQSKTEETVKEMLLIESGIRVHSTQYDWPKNNTPNGFTMKLRKHLKNKRLEAITQLGVDRVVDLQFGQNEASYHVILELYDRGNIVITDYQYIILNILRPRKLGTDEDVNLVVKEKYRIDGAKGWNDFKTLDKNDLKDISQKAKDGQNWKKVLNPHLIYGATLIEHSFIELGLSLKVKPNLLDTDLDQIVNALKLCQNIMENINQLSKGYIIQKEDQRIGEPNASVVSYLEFHPILLNQFKDMKDSKQSFVEMDSFDKAVDTFFSSIESQKIDSKALNQEKEAMKKLEKVKKDHQKRLEDLNRVQEEDIRIAKIIESNSDLVEKALLVLRSAIANQYSWKDIQELIDDAKAESDPIATRITSLKLDKNRFTMKLSDNYDETNELVSIDIDIDLSAFANARKYYDRRRTAAKKEQKTIESSTKAFKNAERKAMQTLKEVAVKTNITKARKVFWFEKFFWFISSDNYIVIAGRDAQQNELIVKRYMKAHDLYVHADIHGATSVVIKNSNPLQPIPPKTLTEAGDLSICYSAAWDSKTVTSAFWVHPNQVSKTAPTGEYLTVGSFMIRGKKNYLPLSHLVMGFGFVFKLDDESTERHRNERKRTLSLGSESISTNTENESIIEEEIDCQSDSDDEEMTFPDTKPKLDMDLKVDSIEDMIEVNNEEESHTIVKSKEPRIKQMAKIKKIQKIDKKLQKSQRIETNVNDKRQEQPKRGQKSKLKKMKEKYKDQDEEERQLRMAILGHSSAKSDQPLDKKPINESNETENESFGQKTEKIEAKTEIKELTQKLNKQTIEEKNEDKTKDISHPTEEVNEEEEEEGEEEEVIVGQSDDVKVIESLTGLPLSEDNPLFAIPVCGPYSSMHSYKYKVKVLPGSNRRGKAAKTCLQLFLKEKTATERERDLLKAVKDQDISKNIPSKIKITTNLSAVKRKK